MKQQVFLTIACAVPLPRLPLSYIYSGHAYDLNDKAEIKNVCKSDVAQMAQLYRNIRAFLPSDQSLTISIGSTPSIFGFEGESALPFFQEEGCQWEIHPGNYTLFDRQQEWSGSCSADFNTKVACRVMARVIGHYPDRNTLIIDAGATALTKDSSPQGQVAQLDGFPNLECYAMSQEAIRVRPKQEQTQNETIPFDELPLGSIVFLKPNHSCLAAACFDQYHIVNGEDGSFQSTDAVIDNWTPVKGWS
jgi:D-serine deaminase-like pyridoxal phosphate-dependent protein